MYRKQRWETEKEETVMGNGEKVKNKQTNKQTNKMTENKGSEEMVNNLTIIF